MTPDPILSLAGCNVYVSEGRNTAIIRHLEVRVT